MMKLLGNDAAPLMEVHSLERDGNELLIRGKVFGTLPMTARLSPAECRNGLRLLSFRLLLFLVSLPLRRSPGPVD